MSAFRAWPFTCSARSALRSASCWPARPPPHDHGNFLAYHVLLGSWTIEAVLLIAAAWWIDRRRLTLAANQGIDTPSSPGLKSAPFRGQRRVG